MNEIGLENLRAADAEWSELLQLRRAARRIASVDFHKEIPYEDLAREVVRLRREVKRLEAALAVTHVT
jgi:hypothetical protein